MRSTLIALFLSAALCASSPAQVVLQPRDIPNRAGSVMVYWTASDAVNGIEVDVGASGPDRRWDLTAYRFDEVSDDSLLNPEEAPQREQFPAANRVLSSDANELGLNLGSGLQYEALTDSGWFMLGVEGGGGFGFNLPIVYPTPLMILPMPAEFEDSWDIAAGFEIGFPAPDTLLGGILDSVYVRISVGGFSSVDGWGVVAFSGGEVPALRQRISTGGRVIVVGTLTIFGRRVEQEVYRQELQATQTYRWLAPAVGEIARITSMLGEESPDFNLASSIRVRRVTPALAFPNPPLAFGIVHVGNAGLAQMIIRNSGEGLGSVARVEFSGGLGAEIEVLSELPFIIEPDSSARLRFLWSPQEEETLDGQTVSLIHNDPEVENPLVVALQGATPEFEGVSGQRPAAPHWFSLAPVSPNPFNSTTEARFSLPQAGDVALTLCDMNGRVVAELLAGYRNAGDYAVVVDAGSLPTGIYLLRLEAGSRTAVQKVALLR